MKKILPFLEKHEYRIPLLLFITFLAITLPGISWGSPEAWHPDEIVTRSLHALDGSYQFDSINFDYPDLPQYAYYWLGKLILSLGNSDVRVWARVLSAVIAGLVIVIVYWITRKMGGDFRLSGLAGLLLLSCSELTHNGRFAHNDTWVTFFVTLAVFCLINYKVTEGRGWLYACFTMIGMAASSKYTGGSLIIAPVALYLISQGKRLWTNLLATTETLFIGFALAFLGYAVGTPRALLWMSYYFKRVFDALHWQVEYGHEPGSVRGIIGQYAGMANGLGVGLSLLFGAALIWTCYQLIRANRFQTSSQDSKINVLAIILLSIFALDLPIMISYNYQLRYFLTMTPLLAILGAFFVSDLYALAKRSPNILYSRLVGISLSLIVLFSLLRDVSVMLLFINDARIPASAYLKTLPAGTSLEYTYYPPAIPSDHFKPEFNYPIYFPKSANDPIPASKKYVFNAGEAGLDERGTIYLVVDSITADRFHDPYLCGTLQTECDFFKKLSAGESDQYKLIKAFKYDLPWYLPQIEVTFANPAIFIYERKQ